jgi:hypothetical protein
MRIMVKQLMLFNGISNTKLIKFVKLKIAKEIWRKLEIIYDGHDKVKKVNI